MFVEGIDCRLWVLVDICCGLDVKLYHDCCLAFALCFDLMNKVLNWVVLRIGSCILLMDLLSLYPLICV